MLPRDPARLDGRDWFTIAALLLLTSFVFANGLRGEFVLDDQKQIVRNDLIRLPRFWPAAMTKDIWSFQGDRDTPWSNYWRPGHVAWLIVNYQLFGPQPFGWHVTNLLAHLGVVASAYVALRWLGAALPVAAAIVAIFAVHPTRVESVTWIAGAHDVLATLWQLLALLCVMSIWRRERTLEPLTGAGRALRWTVAVALYALAVSTKEIAIFFPAILALVRFTDPDLHDARERLRRAILPAIPFAVVAIAFLVARRFVLGGAQLRFPWQPPTMTVITSLPIVVCFYLRQILFPCWVSWSYPVRVVSSENVGFATFYGPLAILVGLALLAPLVVRGRLARIGAAIFVLTLLPALNLKAFLPEQIVKDRYLYLPLLGFLMIVVPLAADALRRALGERRGDVALLVAAGVLAVLLGIRTAQYNRAWLAEVPLWEWAVRNEPTSATNHEILATAYMHAGRYGEARAAYDRALALNDGLTDAYVNRAELAIRERRWDDAVADATRVLEAYPDHSRALERVAIAREGQGRLDEAADVLRRARRAVPHRHAVLTDQLAIVLYKQGRRDEALRELESARAQAEQDFSPASRLVLFHLGMLYDEMGRRDEARATLRRFLELTEGSGDPNLISVRQRAEAVVRR